MFHHKQGQPSTEKKLRLPLRKGVADIALRAKVSQEVNERFASDLALLHEANPVHEVFGDVLCRQTQKRFRPLDPTW